MLALCDDGDRLSLLHQLPDGLPLMTVKCAERRDRSRANVASLIPKIAAAAGSLTKRSLRRSEFSPPVRDWHRWKPRPPLADAGIDKIGMELASRSVRQNLPYALRGAFPPRLRRPPNSRHGGLLFDRSAELGGRCRQLIGLRARDRAFSGRLAARGSRAAFAGAGAAPLKAFSRTTQRVGFGGR